MGKIIKKSVEQIKIKKETFTLGMKGQFIIEFANDNLGPYDYKFEREDCYYNDGLQDRGTVKFPLKNQEFNNTEIFLETNNIVICTGERGGLMSGNKSFIDIINIKTEQKQRIFASEVNLIYNEENKIIVNACISGIFKTLILDINNLNILEEKQEKLLTFFKCMFNETEKKWYILDFQKAWEEYTEGYFSLKKLNENLGIPKSFDREKFLVNGNIDIWALSCK